MTNSAGSTTMKGMAEVVNDIKRAVGFIGLGDQGLPMAVALAEAGFDLHVWSRRPGPIDGLRLPHVQHETIDDLAGACETIALCVRTDNDVFEVTNQLAGTLAPGGIIINHGTGTPTNARRLAEVCTHAGLHALDAPVSGGRMGAEAKTLTTLIGGPSDVATACDPLFRSFSRHIVHLGAAGAGQAAKLFNNTMMIMNQANVADVVNLADHYGLDIWKTIEAIKLCSGFSNSLNHLNTILTLDTMDHLSKVEAEDMDIFAEAMADAGIDATNVVARGRHGARALPDLIRALNR